MTERQADVVVIGAGIVGIACAAFLQRDGRRVTVLDPGGPGEGTSFGNAGCLNGSSVVPVSCGRPAPGAALAARSRRPLGDRWRYLPTLAPWLWRFVRAGQPEEGEGAGSGAAQPSRPHGRDHLDVARDAGAEDLIHRVRFTSPSTGARRASPRTPSPMGLAARARNRRRRSHRRRAAPARAGAVARLRPRPHDRRDRPCRRPASSRRAPRRGVRAQRRPAAARAGSRV